MKHPKPSSPPIQLSRMRAPIIFMSSFAACAPHAEESREHLGSANAAIAEGALDSGESFPEVVAIVDPGATSPGCSGTLISRFWVMSAEHCFDGTPWAVDDDFDVRVGFDPATGTAFNHTFAKSGEVLTHFPTFEISEPELDDTDIAQDVVFFRLDDPVPGTLVEPRRISLQQNACQSNEFTGTLVGYGLSFNATTDAAGTCDDNQGSVRRFGVVSGWDRQDANPTGTIYFAAWTFAVFAPCVYSGFASGDSGGPLIDQQGRLCGVISVDQPFPVLLGVIPGWHVIDITAGVDSAETIDFASQTKITNGSDGLGHGVVDANGNFDGDCPAYFASCFDWDGCNNVELDPDGDDIFSLCDNCPTIYNPEQATVGGDDSDQNGHGAACELCSGQSYDAPATDNRNFEAELATGYPGIDTDGEVPVIGKPGSSPSAQVAFTNAKTKWRNTFKPDVCDHRPFPSHSRVGPPLFPTVRPPIVNCNPTPPNVIPPGCNCNELVGEGCEWSVSPSTLRIAPLTNQAAGGLFPNQNVGVGKRFCECVPLAPDTTGTIRGRQECFKATCDPLGVSFNNGPEWKAIYTEPLTGYGTPNTPGYPELDFNKEFTLPLQSLNGQISPEEVQWFFLQLPGNGVQVTNFPVVGGGPVDIRVEGIMRSKVVRVGPDLVTQSVWADFFDPSQSFSSGDASATLATHSPFDIVSAQPDWFFHQYCPHCPDPHFPMGVVTDDFRLFSVSGLGLDPVNGASAEVVELLHEVQAGTRLFVPASEPLTELFDGRSGGTAVLRAVTLDPEIPQVVDALESFSPDDLPDVLGRGPCIGCSPDLQSNEGLVLSGTLRRLLVIGGTLDGTASGTPQSAAWLLDVDANAWTELPLNDDDNRPGHVLGATFRRGDMNAYVADVRNGQLHLRRYRPKRDVETLGNLPSSWMAFERHHLVSAAGGRLVFAATKSMGSANKVTLCHKPDLLGQKTLLVSTQAINAHIGHGDVYGPCPSDPDNGPTRTLLAVFDVASDGGVTFAGERRSSIPILATPIVTREEFTVVVPDASGGRLWRLSTHELSQPPPGQTPSFD